MEVFCMFKNIGGILKVFAVIFTIIGVIASIILGYKVFDIAGWGTLIFLAGTFLSVTIGLLIGGFGQLIENSEIIVTSTNSINRKLHTINENKPAPGNANKAPAFSTSSVAINCPSCGALNNSSHTFCVNCGKRLTGENTPEAAQCEEGKNYADEEPSTPFTVLSTEHIKCNRCGVVQRSNRTVCMSCGLEFFKDNAK